MNSREEELPVDVSAACFSDLDDQTVSLSAFHGQVVVLTGGGHAAAGEALKWGEPLQREYGARPEVRVLGVAFVEKLPAFIPRGMVKQTLRKMGEVSFLLDWDGSAAKVLDLANPHVPHTFVIDQQGILRFKLVESYSETGWQTLVGWIDRLVRE